MSSFGRNLFGGSRFIFWCVGPLSLLCGLGCLVGAVSSVARRDVQAAVALTLIGVCGVCLFIALMNPKRFLWAARVVTGTVALAYALYFVQTYFVEKQAFKQPKSRAEATPWNAVMGFLVIGVPCVWFTIKGRFGSNAEANQTPEPTPMSVTPPAAQEPRQP